MELNYKLDEIKLIAGDDKDFIVVIIAAFLDEVPDALQLIIEGYRRKNFIKVYQNAHKIKPIIKQFEISIYNDLLVLENWGKNKVDLDVSESLSILKSEIDKVVKEMKIDFKL